MKDKVRFLVEKTESDSVFKFTHIEKREGLDGQEVEVIKGRNEVNLNKLAAKKIELQTAIDEQNKMLGKKEVKKLLDAYKEECTTNLELLNSQLEGLADMQEAISKIISE